MIVFTRLNQKPIALNPDLIQRVESIPDTVITMTDDRKILVKESMDDVVRLLTDYRAYVIARSATIEVVEHPRPTLQLVPTDTLVVSDGDDADHLAIVEHFLGALPTHEEH